MNATTTDVPGQTTERQPVAEISNLGHDYGDMTVFDDLDISLDAGALVAAIGPNGSGKSTLSRILAGVLAPARGDIEHAASVGGRTVGYLPQQPAFRPQFSARETLAFYSELVAGGADPDELLGQVGLEEVGDQLVDALSGGMTRLLGIAQALVGDPPLLVLDEPTSGLDPTMTRRIYGLLREIADDGRTIFVTSHDLASVQRTADRVLLLDRGRLQLDGTPESLVESCGLDSLDAVFADAVEESGATTVRHGVETRWSRATDSTRSDPSSGGR